MAKFKDFEIKCLDRHNLTRKLHGAEPLVLDKEVTLISFIFFLINSFDFLNSCVSMLNHGQNY